MKQLITEEELNQAAYQFNTASPQERQAQFDQLTNTQPAFENYLNDLESQGMSPQIMNMVITIIFATLKIIAQKNKNLSPLPDDLLELSKVAHSQGVHFYNYPSKARKPFQINWQLSDYPLSQVLQNTINASQLAPTLSGGSPNQQVQVFVGVKVFMDALIVHLRQNNQLS